MCKRMGLAIEARETELLAFLASSEVRIKLTISLRWRKRLGKRMLFDGGYCEDYFLECERT